MPRVQRGQILKTVRRRTADGSEEIPLSEVYVGDELVVRPGDSMPTDSEVIEGESAADAAIATAGLTLLKGDPAALLRARRLARAAVRNRKQNLFFAFAYNSSDVPITAGILYPFTDRLLSPMLAAAAMSLSSVAAIGNALRLRRVRL